MRRAALLALLGLCAAAAPAQAETQHVGIPGRYFLPHDLQVVTGDAVAWHNASHETHDVQGERIEPGGEIVRTFAEAGRFPYVCVLHPSMSGVVDVVSARLTGPAEIARGEELVLTGRVPPGTPEVTIERDGAPAATVTPGADGTFRYAAPADASAVYRARTAAGAGPGVAVGVVDRVEVGLRARLGKRLTTLFVQTTPVHPGATVFLQLWSRERFAWRRTQTARLDAHGATTLTVPSRLRRRARVVLLDAAGRRIAVSAEALTWRLSRPPRPPAASPHGGQQPQHGAAHAPPGA
jgi:plastocyanin